MVDRLDGFLTHRNDPLLIPFPFHFDEMVVEVFDLQTAEFGNPQTRRVKKFQDSLVAAPIGSLCSGPAKRASTSSTLKTSGTSCQSFGIRNRPLNRPIFPSFFKKREKNLHRDQGPADARAGVLFILQMG